MSQTTTTTWDGGGTTFGVSWQKLMMWLFIVGDAILFASFLAGLRFLATRQSKLAGRASDLSHVADRDDDLHADFQQRDDGGCGQLVEGR